MKGKSCNLKYCMQTETIEENSIFLPLGSEEEWNDLKEAYMQGKGNMDFIMENVLCASHEDEER